MHPVPGRMRTLCAGKIAAKTSVFKRLFFSARFLELENAHMETALCIYMLPTFSLKKKQQKLRTWKSGLTRT